MLEDPTNNSTMSLDRTLTDTPVKEEPNEHKIPPRTTPGLAAEVDIEKAHTSRPERPPHINASHHSGHPEIPDKQQIEILGRIRPACFKSNWSEYGFVLSLCMAQVIVEYFVSGFNVLVPSVVSALDIPRSAQTWPASAFSLVISCFLLPMGRFSEMYGGKLLFIIGIGWLVIWSIIAGTAKTALLLDFARAISGLGPAAFLPSSIELLGSVYRPGPRKNLVFSLYGACAPLGFFVGIFFAGLAAQLLSWRWYFFIGALLSVAVFFLAWATMPNTTSEEERAARGKRMDWPGTVLIVSGLILVVYALTDCAGAPGGWREPYILITLCTGVVVLGAAVWWEGWRAEQPLLPADIFSVDGFPAVVGAMIFQYGGLGIFLLYTTFYMDEILGATPLQMVAWFTPMCVGGIIIATVGGFVLHIISGTILMLIAGVCWVLAPLLFAVMPDGANYWAWVFPAMVIGTIGIDVSFNTTNVFITTGLPKHQQGLAGAIINSNMHLSIAFFLGLAETIMLAKKDEPLKQQYRYVFWFEVGLAAAALIIMLLFVRLSCAKSDMTADEKARLKEILAASESTVNAETAEARAV